MIEKYLSSQGVIWQRNKKINKINGILESVKAQEGDEYLYINCGLKKEVKILNIKEYKKQGIDIERKYEIPLGIDGLNYIHRKDYMVYEPLNNLIKIKNIKRFKNIEGLIGINKDIKEQAKGLKLVKEKFFEGIVLYRKKYGALLLKIFDRHYYLPKKQQIQYFWKGIWLTNYQKYFVMIYKILKKIKNIEKKEILLKKREYSGKSYKKLNIELIMLKVNLLYIYWTYKVYVFRNLKVFFMRVYNVLLKKIKYMEFMKGVMEEIEKKKGITKELIILSKEEQKKKMKINYILEKWKKEKEEEEKIQKIYNRIYKKVMIMLLEKEIREEKEEKEEKGRVKVKILDYPKRNFYKSVVSRLTSEVGKLLKIKKKKKKKKEQNKIKIIEV